MKKGLMATVATTKDATVPLPLIEGRRIADASGGIAESVAAVSTYSCCGEHRLRAVGTLLCGLCFACGLHAVDVTAAVGGFVVVGPPALRREILILDLLAG